MISNNNLGQTIYIVVDDSAVAAANARTKRSFDDQAKSGVQSWKQIGDASSSTTDLVISNTNRQISAHQRHIQTLAQVAQAHLSLQRILTRTLELATSAATIAGGAAQTGITLDSAVNAYRVARIALSPTPLTAVSLLGGFAVEQSFSAANQQGNFLNSQAMVAARTRTNFQDVQRLAMAAQFSGQGTDYYQKMYADLRASAGTSAGQSALGSLGFSPGSFNNGNGGTPSVTDLQHIGQALQAIVDPAQRAAAAVALFPHTAGDALKSLGRDFDYTNSAINRFNTLLSADATQNIQEFKSNIEDIKGGFREIGEFAAASGRQVTNFFAQIGASLGNSLIDIAKSPVDMLRDADYLLHGDKSKADMRLLSDQAYGFANNQTAFINGRSSQIAMGAAGAVFGPDAARIATTMYGSDASVAARKAAAVARQADAYTRYQAAKQSGVTDNRAAMDLVNATREVNSYPSDDGTDLSRPSAQLSRRISDLNLKQGTAVYSAIQSARQYINKDGDTTLLSLTGPDQVAALHAYFTEFQKLQRDAAKQSAAQIQEEFQTRLGYDTRLFEDRKEKENAIYMLQRDTAEKIFSGERDDNSLSHTLALGNLDLRGLDGKDRTLAELAINNQYSNQTAGLDIEQIARQQRQKLADAGFTDADLAKDSIDNGGVRDQLRSSIIASSGADASAVQRRNTGEQLTNQQQAAIALAQQARDQIQKDFDALKDGAGQVFDALFTKGSNVFQALGNVLKNAVVNALKDAFSNQVAGYLSNAIRPGSVSFENKGGGLLGMLGLPNSPQFSAVGVPTGGAGGGDPLVTAARDSLGADAGTGNGSSGGALAGVPGFPTGALNLLAAAGPSASFGVPDGSAISSGSTSTSMTIDGSAGGTTTSGVAGVAAARDATFGGGTATGGYGAGIRGGGAASTNGLLSKLSGIKNTFWNNGSIQLSPGVASTASGISQSLGGGVLGTLAGGAASFISSPSAAILGGTIGLQGLTAKKQTVGTSAATVGGFGLAGASLGAQGFLGLGLAGGAVVGVGAGLVADGVKRGGIGGALEDTGGGAAIGFEFGGPLGAAIGAGVGAALGIARALFVTTDLEHVKKLAMSLYHLTLSDSIAQQVVQIAKQSYGGQISVAMRAKPVLDLLTLYAQATGQKFGVQNVERPYFLTDTTKGAQQQAFYVDGSAYSYNSPLSVYGGVATTQLNPYITGTGTAKLPGQGNYANTVTSSPQSIQLDGDSTQAFLSGQAVQFVNGNPRVITDANQDSLSGGYGRLSTAAQLLSPTLLT